MKNNPPVLYINAKVWQPDGSFSDCFGVSNGHFDFVASNLQADTLKKNYTEIIDLNGRLVLPGLTDGHLHLVNGALSLRELDCTGIGSISALQSEVKSYVSDKNPKWVTGGNMDIGKIFGDTSLHTGNFADNILSDKPLFINNYDHHSAICNSEVIKLAGLSSRINEFKPGEIELDINGNPTGLIREAALTAVYEVMPELSLNEKVSALSDCISGMHRKGITSVSDITLPHELEIYNELYQSQKLNLRINSYLPFTEFDNIQNHLESTKNINKDYFSIKGFKAFWDGALGSDTALFSRNYKNRNHNGYKTELVSSGKINELAKRIDKAGYQIIIHAIGDKAVSEVLDLYESLPNTKKLRHRIEHAQHIDPADYERFGRLGVIASVQPVHLKYDARVVAEKLPDELVRNTHNYSKITESGGILNFGTDFPIVGFDPFENIQLASTRAADSGIFLPEFKIPVHECIKAYTINNAYSNHNENFDGSISKGKVADFIILNNDILICDPEEIQYTAIDKAFLNGVILY